MTFKVRPEYLEARDKIMGMFDKGQTYTLAEEPDFDHLMKHDCLLGEHCKRNAMSHQDIYGAYWALINDGAISLSMDGDYTLSRGEHYDYWLELDKKRDPVTGTYPENR